MMIFFAVLVTLAALFTAANKYFLARNDKVFEVRSAALDEVSNLCLMDSMLGLRSDWRFRIFERVTYNDMLLSFKKLDTFFESAEELQPLSEEAILKAIEDQAAQG